VKGLYELGKALALKWLPRSALNRLKMGHYLKKVQEVSIQDEPDLEVVRQLVGPGDHVVDLGANIGVYTVFMSKLVKDTGRVFSFEPVPTTFRFLENNVSMLGLRNVALRQAAITDHACSIRMTVPKDDLGADNFYQASIVDSGSQGSDSSTVAVEGLTLDSALPEDTANITFIKCDVEGHELHCLKGATRTIARWKPTWLMEVGGDPQATGSNAAAVFAFMTEAGYGIWIFREGKLKAWSPGDRSVNYLFAQAGAIRDRIGQMIAD